MGARLAADADLTPLGPVRGRLEAGRTLAPLTWFRVGGPAEWFFQPADLDDLAAALGRLPAGVPAAVIGVGSNLLVRDGGVPGVVIRLGRAFGGIETDGLDLRAGAAALDARIAEAAAAAGIAGFEFLRGIPGTLGGALATNAGARARELKDVFVAAEGVTRDGRRVRLGPDEMGFGYRAAAAAEDVVFTGAVLRGSGRDAPAAIRARMAEALAERAAAQPVKAWTAGSTFANPSGRSSAGGGEVQARAAWRLIEEAGCRGLRVGGAQVSEKHCNFLINLGDATAADIESLAETVRARVKSSAGIDLRWEIRRIGVMVN
ncbi:MAG: UDP-N-acetylmuramate dehydrogenase [Paracoccaceae bacterium]